MARRTPSSAPARATDVGRHERGRLDVALRAAGVDIDHGDLDTDDLDAVRTLLLGRLFSRPDDFAATGALQALNVFVAGQRTDARSDAPARLRTSGLSCWQRLRRRRSVSTT